jgi:hypothetical protein
VSRGARIGGGEIGLLNVIEGKQNV